MLPGRGELALCQNTVQTSERCSPILYPLATGGYLNQLRLNKMKGQILPSHQVGILQVLSNSVWLGDHFIGQLRCWTFYHHRKFCWMASLPKKNSSVEREFLRSRMIQICSMYVIKPSPWYLGHNIAFLHFSKSCQIWPCLPSLSERQRFDVSQMLNSVDILRTLGA